MNCEQKSSSDAFYLKIYYLTIQQHMIKNINLSHRDILVQLERKSVSWFWGKTF